LDMRLPERGADQRRLLVRRKSQVDDIDIGILYQVFRRLMDGRNAPALGDFGGIGPGARGDRHDRETGLLIGCEMAFRHDHAGADRTDPVFPDPDVDIRLEPFGISHENSSHYCPAVTDASASPSGLKKCIFFGSQVSATSESTSILGWPRISARNFS